MRHFVWTLFFGAATMFAEAKLAPEISLDELKMLVAKKAVVLLDANSSATYASGHIPGAIHFGSHESDLAAVLPKATDQLVVAYCGGPMCTAWQDAAKAVGKLGFANIKHYKGGIKGWKEAGLEIRSGKK